MKALVLKRSKEFVVEDVPEPELGADDVLVAVRACGICGSDIHGMDGSTDRRRPPVVMGHEAAGVVADVGAAVSGLTLGEAVTFDSTVFCGECPYCLAGLVNLCDRRRVLGVSCEDYRRDGAFAEYVAVPARGIYRLPEGLSFERAAFVEPLSVALHAVRRAGAGEGETAVVVGTGMIGLLAVQALVASGCERVIGIDVDERRLGLAARFGAETLRVDGSDVSAAVRELTDGVGAHVAIEAVGTTSAVGTAVACLRKGGRVSLIGNFTPTIELPLQSVVTREITLRGSCASAGEYPRCLELLASGAIDVDPLTSAVAPLEEGPSWFGRLYDGEPGLMKVILKP